MLLRTCDLLPAIGDGGHGLSRGSFGGENWRDKSSGYPNRLLEFKYDYLGRRVQKRSTNYTASTETYRRYLYDGDNLVAEYDAPGGTSFGSLLKSYTWGLDLAGSLTATGGVGALVQLTDHTTAVNYFPTFDGNDNVASLLRASDGVVVAKYEYSPFGELLRCEGTYAKDNPFRFSTKFTDDESGLVYYGARYYNPGLGRFINRDPIGEQGGLNLYGFCGNDAINGVDYLGNKPWWKKLLNPFGGDNPLNPLSNKNLRFAAMMPHYSNPLYWAAPNFYRKTAPAAEGIAVSIVVSIFTENPALGAAAGGFISGFDSSFLNGGSLENSIKSGVLGAGIALATYGAIQGIETLAASASSASGSSIGSLGSDGADATSGGSLGFSDSAGAIAPSKGASVWSSGTGVLNEANKAIVLDKFIVMGSRIQASLWYPSLTGVGHMMLTIAGTNFVISSYFPANGAMKGKLVNRTYKDTLGKKVGEGRVADRVFEFTASNPESAINTALQEGSKPTWFFLPGLSSGSFTDCIYGATNVLNAGGANLPQFWLPSEMAQYLMHPASMYINPAISSNARYASGHP